MVRSVMSFMSRASAASDSDTSGRWGTLPADNGVAIIQVCTYLAKKYKINHIQISGYNSQANGIVERPHFDIWQALYKASEGAENKWHSAIHSVFWAEQVTIQWNLGVSPFFAVTGTHPLLPLDIVEATYLLLPPESILSTTDLIARQAITLQKRRTQLAEI